jgi:hypothetical protein
MNEHFVTFEERLRLTPSQRKEVKRKHTGVSRSLFEEFYGGDYDPSTRLIIGSHGKKTELRTPLGDVDLIFKISRSDLDRYQAYTSNGPAALLQRAKNKLEETYPVSEKRSWGKVVLIEFATGHNVEVMPCYENNDSTFTIPNSENGGSWDVFDPRKEIQMIQNSNDETGITRKLIRMLKKWNNQNGRKIKPYQIEYFAISFLDANFNPTFEWSQLLEEFFLWLELQEADLSDEALSRVKNARNRAQKAREYELANQLKLACTEWRKVFGRAYPTYDKNLDEVRRLERLFPSAAEEYIHERYPVHIDRSVSLKISSKIKRKGFQDFVLLDGILGRTISWLPKSAKVEFKAISSLGVSANYLWKIRNLSKEAESADDLRGSIVKSSGNSQLTRQENTRYQGTHYIECYAIRDQKCVATARLFVPIGVNE